MSISRRFKEPFYEVSKIAIILITSVLLYYIIHFVLLFLLDLQAYYVDDFIAWNITNFHITVVTVFNISLLTIQNQIGFLTMEYIPITFAFAAALVLFELLNIVTVTGNIRGKHISLLIFLLVLILSPFTMIVALGSIVPQRANLVLGVFIAAIWSIAFLKLHDFKILKYVYVFCVVILISFQARLTTQIMFTDYYLRTTQDFMLATQISLRIGELGLGEIPNEPVVFVGRRQFSSTPPITIRSEISGNPNIPLFAGNLTRTNNYLMHFGINYNFPNAEQIKYAEYLAEQMPIWPAIGSVAYIDGLIIVNLG